MRIILSMTLLVGLTVQLSCADESDSTPDFSSYPKSPAFRNFISIRTTIPMHPTVSREYFDSPPTNTIPPHVILPPMTNQQVVLSVLVFPGHETRDVQGVETYVVHGCSYDVMENGWEDIMSTSYQSRGGPNNTNGETGGYGNLGGGKFLTESELKELHSTIEKLPNQNVSPPLERLALVSFAKGTNWITHTYDRASTPEMVKICKLIGAEAKNGN